MDPGSAAQRIPNGFNPDDALAYALFPLSEYRGIRGVGVAF
jgi:hypothetical protein